MKQIYARSPWWLVMKFSSLNGLIFTVFCTLVWGWQMALYDRMLPTFDLFTHYRWTQQFLLALSEGTAQPKWAALSHLGAGDPTFFYYQPGFYYCVALLNKLGLSVWTAIKASLLISNLTLGLTVYLILRHEVSDRLALLGAGFAQLQPFPFFLAYYYNSLPWMFAVPFAVIVVWRSSRSARPEIDLMLSIALALLVLSHILTAFMCLLVLGLERLIRLARKRDFQDIIYWVLSISLGLGIAAFYFAPAFLARDWINPQGWFQEQVLDWRNSFAFPALSAWWWGVQWMSVQWIHPAVLLIAFIAVAIVIYYHHQIKTLISPLIFNLVTIAILAFLLASELSLPAWGLSETLRIIQRPYRFTALMMLSVILLVPLVLALGLPRHSYLRGLIVMMLLAPLLLFFALQFQVFFEGKSPQPRFEQIMQGDFGQPEYFPAGVGSSWKTYFTEGGLQHECADKSWLCADILWRTHHRAWRLEGSANTVIRLPVFDFPAWQVRKSNRIMPKMTDPETGLIRVELLAGQHELELIWVPTLIERAGQIISTISLVVVIILLTYRVRKKRHANV
ncbi:MAG: hypothetical protein IPL99_01060 [Candidatus Competibacteraceae bacterium]|nr:hypothetical protein [Candidatus Competibacteraceae bacterium]